MNELMQQALYRIAELERKMENLGKKQRALEDVVGSILTDEKTIQHLSFPVVSSLSRMDALAKEEYYPFGQPVNKEDE